MRIVRKIKAFKFYNVGIITIRSLLFLFCIGFGKVNAEPLTIVTELSPPYQTLEQNHIGGYATEQVRAFMLKANLSYEIEMYPWARAFRQALNKPNTLIYAIAKTPERLDKFHWFIKVYEFRPYLVGHDDKALLQVKSLQQVKEYSIAVQRHDYAHEYLSSIGFEEGKNLILTNSIVDSWHLLKNKKVDFVVEEFEYDPISESGEEFKYKKYIPLKSLWQSTYLAANKNLDKDVLEKMMSTMKEFEQTR
ncbi:transporter substrate-binding domain-containing protein [Psychrosphaera sp. B3R10]|uniref:transporter substrate-binding domain-containing protein n=1 Tax=unclassified Psychrosphaera TaxID=2641570 RepID=UPI001C085B51|nr:MULTISPECIES: transporter substrate-binding domain-containing protein [unclassified Psychrosphaera]MBU2881815.1 transporter substrate-binding domain-containing protein [Psychrosphaera sp. I2R16]MBU2988095.1 transporter substrate-binding domain-containing protein [Psychrosphaera sp. B3R10]